jgi:hypothetical protein
MMRRRSFITLGGTVAWPVLARAVTVLFNFMGVAHVRR